MFKKKNKKIINSGVIRKGNGYFFFFCIKIATSFREDQSHGIQSTG